MNVYRHILAVDVLTFLIGQFIIQGNIIIKNFRIKLMLHELDDNESFWNVSRMNLGATLLGCITPGKVGEIYKAIWIEKKIQQPGAGYAVIMIEKILDSIIVLIILFFGLLFSKLVDTEKLVVISAIMLICVSICFYIVLVFNKRRKLYIRKKNLINTILNWFKNVILTARYFSVKTYCWLIFLSLIMWTLFIIGYGILFISMQVRLGIIPLISSLSISWISQAIPLTVAGIGSRDVLLLIYLNKYQYDSSKVLAISSLFLITWLFTIAISYPFWLTRKTNLLSN